MRSLFLCLMFFTIPNSWSQAGDRIGNGMPDTQIGQILQRFKGEMIVCNVFGSTTVKSKFNQAGERVFLSKKTTRYSDEITDGQTATDYVEKITGLLEQSEGPTDVPYTVVNAYFKNREVVLFEQHSGIIKVNFDHYAVALNDLIQKNCQD